jgi:hypothetical protein
VAAANGLGEKVLTRAVIETPESRRADIFNRTEEERNICGQTVILKDGRCGIIVTVAKLAGRKDNVAFFRQQGKRTSKGIDNCETLRLTKAFEALKRAQEKRKTNIPTSTVPTLEESDDDFSETVPITEIGDLAG